MLSACTIVKWCLLYLSETANHNERQHFLGFASFLSGLGPHPFLPNLLGMISVEPPLIMVMEELQHQDLLGYLWKCRQVKENFSVFWMIVNIFCYINEVISFLPAVWPQINWNIPGVQLSTYSHFPFVFAFEGGQFRVFTWHDWEENIYHGKTSGLCPGWLNYSLEYFYCIQIFLYKGIIEYNSLLFFYSDDRKYPFTVIWCTIVSNEYLLVHL